MANPLDRAIEAAGTVTALAKRIGVGQSAVSNWRVRGVSLDACPAIEAATGVRCEDLRPDVHWNRNEDGAVTGYTVPLPEAASRAA